MAQPGFDSPQRNDVYRAAQLGGAQNNDVRSLFVVARLRPAVSFAEAESRLAAFAAAQAAQYPAANSDIRFRIVPLRDASVGAIRPYLLLTLGLAALVLAIRTGSPPAVVLGRPLAERLFGPASPLGRRVRLPELLGSLTARQQEWLEVVGVAEGVRSEALMARPGMDLYLSNQQQFAAIPSSRCELPGERTRWRATPPKRFARSMPASPFSRPAISRIWRPRRCGSAASPDNSDCASAPSPRCWRPSERMGLLAYAVSQRGRELAIRQALGSPPEQVRSMVVNEGMRLAAAGLAAASVVLASAWLACYIPARRASRVAPADALRAD